MSRSTAHCIILTLKNNTLKTTLREWTDTEYPDRFCLTPPWERDYLVALERGDRST